jgi:hypothetical protein
LVVRNSSKIKIFGSLREIPRAAGLEKGKHGALRRVAMERVFGLRGCFRSRAWRGSRNGLGASGGPEDRQSPKQYGR